MATACMVRGLFIFAAAESPAFSTCHQEVTSEVLVAMETQKRFLGQVSQQDGCVPSWSSEGWSLRVHTPVPALLIPAGNHKLCRVGR